MRCFLAFVLGCLALSAQVVQEAFSRDPGPLDFIRGEGFEQAILQSLTGDSLVGLDPQGRIVPRLAERWEAKGTALRFWLRKDARFADGSPVRLEDAVWTIRTIQGDPKASPTKRAALEGLQAQAGAGVLELQGNLPAERLLCNLTLVPVAQENHPERGSGPFGLRQVSGEWNLEARPHFMRPRIPGLRFRLIGDDQARLLNLQKGWLTLGVPPARRGQKPPEGYREILQPMHAQLLVWSRAGQAPLQCLERWREAIPEDLFGGMARPSRGLLPESLGFAVRRMAGPALPPARGSRWEILYTAGDELVERLLLVLREKAKGEGLNLEPRPVEAALLLDRLVRGDFQLACASNVFEPHPWSVLDLMEPKGALNFTGWRHPGLPALVPRLGQLRSSAWGELQSLWAEQPHCLPLVDYQTKVWVDKRLTVVPSALGLYRTTPGAAGWTWR